MPRSYKPIEECRQEIQDYAAHLNAGTDDSDTDQRNSNSTKRYEQDLRWFDGWLDDQDITSALDVTPREANRLGQALSSEFNGTTGRYRWDRLVKMYQFFVNMEDIQRNPLAKWNDDKTENWGLTKTTEQSRQGESDDTYAVSQDDVRKMEENVGRNRLRDQMLIRLLYHTGMRRGEAAELTLDMLVREKREITLPARITKNNKERVVVWQPNLDGLLTQWLDMGYRDEYLAGEDYDHLFIGERHVPLSAGAINDVVVTAADNAGINEKTYSDANAPEPEDEDEEPEPNRWKISAHSIRKGTATAMIDSDASIYAVSKYLGHESVKITEEKYLSHDPKAGVEDAHRHGPE